MYAWWQDVAARGLDVRGLSAVINYGPPPCPLVVNMQMSMCALAYDIAY